MAITVTDANPTVVTVVSNTVTTNTLFPANAPNDGLYQLADDIIGIVNPGIAVGGAGLALSAVVAGGGVAFTNHGFISVAQADPALILIGNGDPVTYEGAGTLTNSGAAQALRILSNGGSAAATVGGNITSNGGVAVDLNAATTVTLTQAAATVISTTLGLGADAIRLVSTSGNIVATLDGAVVADQDALEALALAGNITVGFTGQLTANQEGMDVTTPGAITINSSGNINAVRGIQAVGSGAGLITVNVTAGQIDATSAGLELVSSGTGGIVVDMTGGQIGSATQRTGVGIIAQSNGTGGALDLTVSSVWSNSTALIPSIGDAANGDDITLTINGTVDSLGGNGIAADHFGTGDIFITNNGTILAGGGGIGIVALLNAGNTRVFNAGTVTGASGTAILLDAGDDTLTLTPTSVINGTVLAQSGSDTLQLGGTTGIGTFDVSDIGAAQQYRFFEIFNVIGATWILTGTATATALQDWTMSGGTLGGTATIGGLNVTGGTVAPGQSAGILSTAGLVLGAAATFAVEIGGINPGTGHDQIAVTAGPLGFGTVALGGTLAPTLINGFSPAPGTEFVIIANDGGDAVTGTFAGLAEGALFTAGGSGWRISYAGGDGNDVALTALEPAANDLNGDFHSDIVWRDDVGVVVLWEMDGASVLSNQGVGTLPAGAEIADADGDFNGDGASDILWRDADGTVVLWEMNGPAIIGETAIATLPDYWRIADTGDLNGDGRHDILWRDDAGTLVLWEMDGPNVVGNTLVANVAVTTTIEAVADFSGDGLADILLREADGTVRLWEMDGASIVNDTVIATLPEYWHIADIGDFNGDFRHDILWRDTAGTVVMWEMDGATVIGNTALGTLPDYWQIADTGDYTGDLRDDILWRDDAGTIVLWEMDGPTIVDSSAVNTIPTNWQIEA
jgi:hypothetical protein